MGDVGGFVTEPLRGPPTRHAAGGHHRPVRVRWRLPRPGLRVRAAIAFASLGCAVALGVAAGAYLLARGHLVDERQGAARQQLHADARLVRGGLRAGEDDVIALLSAVSSSGNAELHLVRRGSWFSSRLGSSPDVIPADLRSLVDSGGAGQQRFRDGDGTLQLAQGVALPAVDAALYEVVALDELEATLGVLRTSFAVAVAGATVVSAVVGHRLATRLTRPLAAFRGAARRLAAGDLGTRLDEPVDADLRSLAAAFNEMAEELDQRIRRDMRYAADVSHELRSPLAAIVAAVDVLARRRHELSDTSQAAFDVLEDRVESFRRSVDDLMEMARIDAGRADLHLEELDVAQFARELLRARGAPDVRLEIPTGTTIVADRRRLAQSVGNLLDNACTYAGGATAIVVEAADGVVRLAVEDDGPGVAPEERAAVFGRFARGRAGMDAGRASGSGLGLALVAEHMALHRGRAWVEEANGGGARFVLELPATVTGSTT